MRRKQIKLVAAMLLALHGLIAVAGNSGLHVITGCSHHDAAPCSHDHDVACIDGGCDRHESEHKSIRVAHIASDACDGHNCPICQWWLANGRFLTGTACVVCLDQTSLTGIIGDCGLLSPTSELRECFPRGPPTISFVA